jgi:magnesium chelatase family protein
MIPSFSKLYSAETQGVGARLVEVEIDFSPGLHFFVIIGLADKSLQEARDRINSALKNSNIKPPSREHKKITINLAPADTKKSGSQYDLALAIGYLLAGKQIKDFGNRKILFLGELGLDGNLRPIRGALAVAEMAKRLGFDCLVLPEKNAPEAAAVSGPTILGAKNLLEVIDYLEGRLQPKSYLLKHKKIESEIDFSDIKGQEAAKRALTIAASGGHNILLIGPPGVGKSYLSKAFSGILPDLSKEEAVEVTKIYSAAGFLPDGLITTRPFRAPHHTSSLVSLVGGGSDPRPGEISLAHRGVLFLDETPEFPRSILEALRQPLEDGEIVINRAQNRLVFPARFILILAMNPCPCGYYGDEDKECVCSPYEVLKYKKKLSGPLLDRIDMVIRVPRISLKRLTERRLESSSNHRIRNLIEKTREVQLKRCVSLDNVFTNSNIPPKNIDDLIKLDATSEKFINSLKDLNISPRSYYKILKTAQTIADLDGGEIIKEDYLAEAYHYRLQETF